MEESLLHTLPVDEKIGVCVSGGLDSRTICAFLVRKGLKVTAFCVDVGQPDAPSVSARMRACGVETVLLDGREAMAEACFDLVAAKAKYDGGYWNTTGAARRVICGLVVPAMLSRGIRVFAHGATARGNDQVRFERYALQIYPELKIYAPWRDPECLALFPGRSEMRAFLKEQGLAEAEEDKVSRYSVDTNLGGSSHEGADLESLETSCLVTPLVHTRWPWQCPSQEQASLQFGFRAGRCCLLQGMHQTALEVMRICNAEGYRFGLGVENAVENRILNTKSRGVYEAPGLTLLSAALDQLLQVTLDGEGRDLYEYLSRTVSKAVYHGTLQHAAAEAANLAVKTLLQTATGTVTLRLSPGCIFTESISDVPGSLYVAADCSMESGEGLNARDAAGVVTLLRSQSRGVAASRLRHRQALEEACPV